MFFRPGERWITLTDRWWLRVWWAVIKRWTPADAAETFRARQEERYPWAWLYRTTVVPVATWPARGGFGRVLGRRVYAKLVIRPIDASGAMYECYLLRSPWVLWWAVQALWDRVVWWWIVRGGPPAEQEAPQSPVEPLVEPPWPDRYDRRYEADLRYSADLRDSFREMAQH